MDMDKNIVWSDSVEAINESDLKLFSLKKQKFAHNLAATEAFKEMLIKLNSVDLD